MEIYHWNVIGHSSWKCLQGYAVGKTDIDLSGGTQKWFLNESYFHGKQLIFQNLLLTRFKSNIEILSSFQNVIEIYLTGNSRSKIWSKVKLFNQNKNAFQ